MKKIFRITLLFLVGLSCSSITRAQELADSKVKAPSVGTHYMIAFKAYQAVNPGIAFNAEWRLDNEWVLSAEIMGGYNMILSLMNDPGQFFLNDAVSARWYFNRNHRARLGRSTRKNSGLFLEVGLEHLYFHDSGREKRKQYDSSSCVKNNDVVTTHLNVLDLFTAFGFKLVSKSNVFFSGKVGLGYGVGTVTSPNETAAHSVVYPSCDIKIGYCF